MQRQDHKNTYRNRIEIKRSLWRQITNKLFLDLLIETTRPDELLSTLVNPLIRDPFHAQENWTGSVPCAQVTFSISQKVVPKESVSNRGQDGRVQMIENCRSSHFGLRHLNVLYKRTRKTYIEENSSYPISCVQSLEGVLLFLLSKVEMGIVMSSETIVGHLEVFRRGLVQIGHVLDSSIDSLDHWRLGLLQPGTKQTDLDRMVAMET